MRYLKIIVTICTFFMNYSMQAQPKYNPEAMYLFKDQYYINLDNLEKIDIDVVLAKDFKTNSKYANRFKDAKPQSVSKTNNIIKDENEKNIIGKVKIKIKDGIINMTVLNNAWKDKIDEYGENTEAILKDDILVVANYSWISTGSHLRAYDIRTHRLLWKADVKQLNIPHSKYFNKVILSRYKNNIIMEGIEAGGNYVQIFDIKTGKSLALPFLTITSMGNE